MLSLVCVIGTAVPPAAVTLASPPTALGVNTIRPSRFQVPPRPLGASQTVCRFCPSASIRLSLPSAKKPTLRPSADQNGYSTPAVPSSGKPLGESSLAHPDKKPALRIGSHIGQLAAIAREYKTSFLAQLASDVQPAPHRWCGMGDASKISRGRSSDNGQCQGGPSQVEPIVLPSRERCHD